MPRKIPFWGVDYSLTSPAITKVVEDTWHSYCMGKEESNDYVTVSKYPDFFSQTYRRRRLADWAISVLTFDRGLVMLESYAFGARGDAVTKIAENGGVLKHEMLNYGIPFETVPPTTIKKYATGKGNAKKLDMYDAFVERTGVEVDHFKAWSDIVDSYFIAMYFRDRSEGLSTSTLVTRRDHPSKNEAVLN